MDDVQAMLEKMHAESFCWALCCCRHDREVAREVLQQVYLKVLDGRARYGGEGSFKTWLFAVIRRTALDEKRRSWVRGLSLMRYWQRRKEEVAKPLPEDAEDLLRALGQLPRQQREVLHLVFYDDLSVVEAVEVMGVSAGTARTHYHRAKEALRELLGPEHDGRNSNDTRSRRNADAGAVR